MVDKLKNQKKTYEFLLDNFKSQDSFSKNEFKVATGWGDSSFDTYWSKQYKTLLVKISNDSYRVSEAFRRFIDWKKFKGHVSQTRKVAEDYSTLTYDNVILFEFFMPLTNEGYLISSLDALFFKDSVESRLKTIGQEKLEEKIPREKGETDSGYHEKICDLISNTFGGYSISHVSGRYRADRLKTHQEIHDDLMEHNDRYLVDETTAVVKFIFPCGEPTSTQFLSSEHYFEDLAGDDGGKKPNIEAATIRWLFYVLFVQSIVQVVNGEDEIWMLESGMRNRLHIWRVNDD